MLHSFKVSNVVINPIPLPPSSLCVVILSVPNFNNIQEPTGIGFNRNMENDLEEFGSNNPYENRSNFETKQSANNSGMYVGNMKLPDDGSKKKFPWFILAGALVVVMFLGIAVLPHFNKLNVKVYEDDLYSLEYNANWYVDEEKEDMTLYYSDKNSRLIFNALSSFTALNGTVSNESGKKDLYQQFYSSRYQIIQTHYMVQHLHVTLLFPL